MTSKLQVTLPKALAERYRIRPGDEIEWEAAGDVIRVIPNQAAQAETDPAVQLRLFDEATKRQEERNLRWQDEKVDDRGWKREDLYSRGLPR